MIQEIIVLIGTMIAGAVSGAALVYILSKVKISSLKKQQQYVVKPFSNAKAELQSLHFEKSLVSQAITRVYEAVQEGKVDSVDRDKLLVKYKHQLDAYDEKISTLQSTVDFADLYEMRKDIVGLLERRITAIDKKLVELSKKCGMEAPESIKIPQQDFIKKQWEEEEEKEGGGRIIQPLAKVEGIKEEEESEEKNIELLQKEIIEALYRLDQAEVDDNEQPRSPTISTPSSFNDKSCLRQFR